MKKRDLEKALAALGYWRAGGTKHDKWINDQGWTVMVPRHRELNEFTAIGILRQAQKGTGK